ncbi:Sorting nexin [Seminavis robusta]|uniref:Sorting nexin n=1 Tax=Seminavis robusta TaxID=568900 RepID=A0A9N8E685_9STRA|nr:Sorting nexin [Seminavis robusta]|eukprot:Sro593_g172290.1 Sorting nexin (978) ;mRNA; r:22783-26004
MSNDKTASLMASLTLGAASSGPAGGGDGDEDLFGDIPIDDTPPPVVAAPAPFPQAQQQPVAMPNTTLNGSVYHDPMSMPPPQQQQQPNPASMPPSNGNSNNFPYPQPQQMMPNAPNITYVEPSSANPMAASQPVISAVPPASATSNNNMSKSLLLNSGLLGAGPSSDEKKADLGGMMMSGGGGGLFDDIDQEEQQKAQAAAAEKKRQEEEAAAAEQQRKLEEQLQQQQEQQRLQQQQQQQQTLPGQQMQNNQQQQMMMNQPGQMSQPGHMQNSMQNSNQQQQPMSSQQPGQINQPGPTMPNSQPQPNNTMPQQPVNQNPMMQQQQPQQPPAQINVPGIMYREHAPDINSGGGMAAPPQQPQAPMQQQNNASPNRYYQPSTQGSVMAGMHNTAPMPQQQPYGGMQPQQRVMPAQSVPITRPPDVPTYYGKVVCNDPVLLQAPSKLLGMVSSPPHWSYQFTTQIKGQPPSVWMVRRRFRHVVALEDRLRVECPGAILPPRPDKHVGRAIEEASTHQSAEFAWQRAGELEQWLNALVGHPEVFASQSLKMFLGLQDDMGTAWPEVSSNAFTRMSSAVTTGNASASFGGFFGSTAAPANTNPGQTGVMNNVIGSVANNMGVGELAEAITEDSAELLALSSSESIRMGAILQAVPKLEGAVTLLREQGEGAGAVGMELNRLAKEVLQQGDRELAMPLEIFSNGLLRYGRRTKRLGQEIGQATMSSFHKQYKLCRYEKLAWGDRRNALAKRTKERGRADKRAQQLMVHQQQYGQQYGGGYGHQQPGGYGGQPNNMMMNNQYNGGNPMDQMMSNATMSDNMAVSAVRECDEIGERLKREVNRISFSRRMDWSKSMKVIASYMKEAAAERVAIWESTRDTFLQTFPEYHNDTSQWTNVSSPRSVAPQPQQQQIQQPVMGQPQMSSMNPGMNMNSSFMGQGAPAASMGMGQSYMQVPPQQQQQQPQQFVHNSMMNSGMIQPPQQPR